MQLKASVFPDEGDGQRITVNHPLSIDQSIFTRSVRASFVANAHEEELPSQPWNESLGHEIERKKGTMSQSGRQGLNLLTGTMPRYALWVRKLESPVVSSILRFLDASLRGYSQVFVISNPLCGLLILCGIFYDSWYTALASLVAVVSATFTAMLLGMPSGAISAGLYGYNGVLTGIALVVFSANDRWSEMLGPVIVMSAVSTILTNAFGTITVGLLGMPPTTFPFQVATWLWLLAAQNTFSYFPSNMPFSPQIAVLGTEVDRSYETTELIEAVFRGVSQVFLINNTATGGFFLVGLAISSPIASCAAFVGSGVGVLTSLALGVDATVITAGLFGFNSSLTALCVGGMFYVLSRKACCLAVFAAMVCVIVHAGVGAFLQPVGLPTLTFPFTLTTWVFILLGRGTKFAFPVELVALTTPEDHVNRYRVARLTTKTFTDCTQLPLGYLTINNEEDLARIEKQMLPALLCCLAAQGKIHRLRKMGGGENAAKRLSLADYDGRTPLMLAAAEQHMNVLHYLLKLGCDVSALDRYGGCALEDALRGGSLAAVRLLIRYKAKLNPKSTTLYQAEEMCYAAAKGDLHRLQLLVEAGVPCDSQDYDKRTALHLAAANGRTATVEQLLSLGADSTIRDRFGNTPKDDAVRYKHKATAASFASARLCPPLQGSERSASEALISINQYAITEWLKATVLCDVVARNSTEELLAMLGDVKGSIALLNDGDYDKRTALMVACASGSFEAVELLLVSGANANIVDRWGSCALWECITHSNDAIARLLLTYGAEVTCCRSKVVSYLCQLVTDSNLHQLEYALRILGQNVGGKLENYDMRTPLHLAADEQKTEITRVLAASGLFDPAAPDRWGKSALFSSKGIIGDKEGVE
jgi:solute carrier family 14 (urea transporter)